MSLKKIIKQLLFLHPYSPTKNMDVSYYHPTDKEMEELRRKLADDYFANFPEPFPTHDKAEVENGFSWMDDHLYLRLESFRNTYVPFLNKAMNLKGKTVMDVGCGTGSSLVALAEAGAIVYGIDIDQPSLDVAKKRCEIYKSKVDISLATATDILSFKPEVKFDFIIFNASLEHMYLKERLASLHAAWERLSSGGCMAVIECPNRLWYFDVHTSQLPFYDWLPHDLALMYTRFSPRKFINELYKLPENAESFDQFIRVGRGMSYHEIDLAIKQNTELKVVGTLGDFIYENCNWLDKSRVRKKTDYKYQKFLQEKSGININKAYCEEWLNFVLRKD